MFALGTPLARAFLRTLKSAMFFSGSVEPPSEGAHQHKDGRVCSISPQARGQEEYTHDARLSRCPGGVVYIRMCTSSVKKVHRVAYAEGSSINFAATLVVGTFLLLDL